MKWLARLLLVLSALTVPAYLLLDRYGRVPVAVRDRPWPFALAAVLLSLAAWRVCRRARTAALVIMLASSAALGGAAYSRYRLPPSSAEAGVGAPLPELTLPDQTGKRLSLRALDGRPLVLIWFRGSWCPYCRQQLSEIEADLAHFSAADVRVLAVSPDPPEPLVTLQRELKLTFPLLSDPDRLLVNRCQLTHCVAIVDGSGVVRWGVVSGNWQKDLPARALLQAAYRQ